jgi:glucose-6-phosphate isomerase
VDDRFAIWSATGLPIMLSIGVKHFNDFLDGAYEMDEHYKTAPLEENMPVIMALIGIWYNNFFKAESQAILTYDYHLSDLPKYIEQIDMQGNGKSVDRDGNKVDYPTGPIIWGGNGLHTQHAFYQMLHRGKKIIPADFIVSMRTHSVYQEQHNQLFSNAIAQAEALMRGRNLHETIAHIEHTPGGFDQNDIDALPYRVYGGNNPSNMLLMQRLTPKSLGIILALYEHKTFTQGSIWGLSPFDQRDIGLGDSISNLIMRDLRNNVMPAGQHDASTNALIKHYKKTVYPERKHSV